MQANQANQENAANQEVANREYQSGRMAFERGQYRESVQSLEKASALISRNTRLGGEVQMWLVTAYEAAGQRSDALDLCRQLVRHPDLKTRKQARRLLYILEAPQLKTRPEWLTEIPDLTKIEGTGDRLGCQTPAVAKRPSRPRPKPKPEPEDLSQINTQDNRFIWFALVAIAAILGGLFWLS